MSDQSWVVIIVGLVPSIAVFGINLWIRKNTAVISSGADWLLIFLALNLSIMLGQYFALIDTAILTTVRKIAVLTLTIVTFVAWTLVINLIEPKLLLAYNDHVSSRNLSNNTAKSRAASLRLLGWNILCWICVLPVTAVNVGMHYPDQSETLIKLFSEIP